MATFMAMETSAGSIELELYADKVPRTVYNFASSQSSVITMAPPFIESSRIS